MKQPHEKDENNPTSFKNAITKMFFRSKRLRKDIDIKNLDGMNMVYFGLLILIGIVTVLFGKTVLSVTSDFKYLRLFAWLTIIYGVCMASIILVLLAIPLALVLVLVMALIFFVAAKELETLPAQQD